MLFPRVLSAVIGIPLAALAVFAWGGDLLAPLVGIFALVGLHEFYSGARRMGAKPHDWLGRGACVLLIAYARIDPNLHDAPIVAIALLFLLLVALIIELVRPDRAPVRNISATALGVLYVGWLFSYVVLLRDFGPWPLAFVLLGVWTCDTGAFLAGKLFGRHKLAPSVSPAKTIEGMIGGLIASTAVALATGGWLGIPMWQRAVLGLTIGVFCVLGDLCESAMKREIGIKDFGSMIPGHGGVLDRFDGLLFAAPVIYYLGLCLFLSRGS